MLLPGDSLPPGSVSLAGSDANCTAVRPLPLPGNNGEPGTSPYVSLTREQYQALQHGQRQPSELDYDETGQDDPRIHRSRSPARSKD